MDKNNSLSAKTAESIEFILSFVEPFINNSLDSTSFEVSDGEKSYGVDANHPGGGIYIIL